MSKKSRRQFQSEETQSVARTTRELEVLGEALRKLQDRIDASTDATEKAALTQKKVDLVLQETLGQARQSQAVSRFQSRYGSSLSADEIRAGAENARIQDENNKKWGNAASKITQGANILIDAATKLASISYDSEYEAIAARTDILLSDIDALGQKSLLAAELTAKTFTSAVQSSLTSITDGINEGAYAAANNLIDLGTQAKMLKLEKERIELENKNTKQLRTEQRDATFSNLYAQQTQAEVTAGAELTRMAGHGLNNVEILGESAGEAPGAVADIVGGIAQGAAAATSTMIQSENKLIVQRYENNKKVTEAVLKSNQAVEKAWIEAGANVEKAWLQFAQKIEGGLLKSEAAANDMGVSMGYSGKQLASFKKTMFDTQVAVSRFGKKLEDMQKMQNGYQESTGRNIQLSDKDFKSSFAFDVLSGQDGLSTQLASGMELFNHSVSDSNEMVMQMFDNVSRIGLNGRKYMKDIVKQLKLAEKYQFKGGVKGLMEMAKWAQQTRFNMDNLGGMIDKIEEGGLEGVITQAANMQVLGGNFAMGADPLAMAWESGNDPAALADRYQKMIGNIGTYDSKTGEAYINQTDQWRLRAFAKYSGEDYGDLQNQIRQRIKGSHVERQLDKSMNWNDEQKALITNKAQLNRKTGQYEIDFGDGRGPVDVKNLTNEDMVNLMPVEERIEDHVGKILGILSMDQRLAGTKQYAQSKLEAGGYDQWLNEEQQRMQNVISDFDKNYETYLGQFKEKMAFATKAQSTMLDLMTQGNENISNASSEILAEGQNIASSLSQANQLIQDALKEIDNRKNEAAPKQGEIAHDNAHATNRLLPYDARFNLTWKNPLENQSTENDSPKVKRAKEAAKKGDYCTAVQNSSASSWSSIKDGTATADGKPMSVAVPRVTPIHDGAVSSDGLPMTVSASNVTPIHDGAVAANGNPMAVAASRVTPIHDGAVAKTDSQDHAIFAKVGGQFDKLFNGVFERINAVYDTISQMRDHKEKNSIRYDAKNASGMVDEWHGIRDYAESNRNMFSRTNNSVINSTNNNNYSNVQPRAMVFGEMPRGGNSNIAVGGSNNSETKSNAPIKVEPITLNIKLDGALGQSSSFLTELENDPTFRRSLVRIITTELSIRANGGKAVYHGGL